MIHKAEMAKNTICERLILGGFLLPSYEICTVSAVDRVLKILKNNKGPQIREKTSRAHVWVV